MTAHFSDFESCLSSSDEEATAKEADDDGFKSMNDKKRKWKSKRKTNTSPPGVESFLKKVNRNSSPKFKVA